MCACLLRICRSSAGIAFVLHDMCREMIQMKNWFVFQYIVSGEWIRQRIPSDANTVDPRPVYILFFSSLLFRLSFSIHHLQLTLILMLLCLQALSSAVL
jgi:hypothetical protein